MKTNPVVEIAEQTGLINDKAIQSRLPHLQSRELDELYERLVVALRFNNSRAYEAPPSSYNFFASSAMRGDRFCLHAECRLKKLPLIARYASLYSDRMLLPVRMSDESKRARRLSVETALRVTATMRPLVDEGLIIPIATGLNICRNCQPLADKEVEAVAEIGNHLAAKNLSRFSAGYFWEKKRGKHIFILLTPEEFGKDGGVVREFRSLPKWFAGPERKARELTQSEIRDSGLVEILYNSSAFDIFTQAAMAKGNGCSYLSDSEAESSFFDDPDSNATGVLSRSQFAETLMHSVPMFRELELSSILTLRREYPDSFQAYRSALNSAMAESTELMSGGEAKAKQFFKDVIEPKVDELRALDNGNKLTTLKTLGTSLVLPTVSLLFGMLDHNLPHTITDAARLLGAAGLAKAVVDPVSDGVKRKTSVRANPYFFLLKLDRKWKADRESCRSQAH